MAGAYPTECISPSPLLSYSDDSPSYRQNVGLKLCVSVPHHRPTWCQPRWSKLFGKDKQKETAWKMQRENMPMASKHKSWALPRDTNSDHNSYHKKNTKRSGCSPQYDFHFPLLRLDDQAYSLQVGSTVGTFSCHAQKSLLSKFDIGISNGMPHASSLSAHCG